MSSVHQAGPMIGAVQVCSRCGIILTDYRGAMVPEEDADKPLRGWAEGAWIEVSVGNPIYMGVTDGPPTCDSFMD